MIRFRKKPTGTVTLPKLSSLVNIPFPHDIYFRICRLKKKAFHEANKIKYTGLELEYSKFTPIPETLLLPFFETIMYDIVRRICENIDGIWNYSNGYGIMFGQFENQTLVGSVFLFLFDQLTSCPAGHVSHILEGKRTNEWCSSKFHCNARTSFVCFIALKVLGTLADHIFSPEYYNALNVREYIRFCYSNRINRFLICMITFQFCVGHF